jgi:hypothetical protein
MFQLLGDRVNLSLSVGLYDGISPFGRKMTIVVTIPCSSLGKCVQNLFD